MCDYSLEMYQSRPAVKGERYETVRFPSGSIGFAAPGDANTAVCMACDTRLELSKLPPELQRTARVSDTAVVTFIHIEHGLHHDGVRFENGTEANLQQLGSGVSAVIVDDLVVRPAVEADRPRIMEPAE